MPHALRFSTHVGGAPSGGAEFLARVRALEAMGCGTVLVPDHVASRTWSPLVALGAAAAATSTVRLGTLVIDNDFRDPLMLAREVATLDVLSNGRI